MKIGKGDRLALFCANGCTREQLDETAERALGSAWKPVPAPEGETETRARAGKQAAALRLWSGSTPCQGTPAAAYLARRGLATLATSPALRCRPDCWHPEGGRYPALVALVEDAAGKPLAVHRTYLRPDGSKADADPVKASLGPVWGGAIRLDRLAPELVIGEGIETSASAGRLLGLPAWAALSAGNLALGLALPAEVRAVVIAADADGPG
ncbi:MAG: toprim domain-containing protein, partial [Candidatus Dormibacteraeota bacterium]|nr:toprim domain-containing protein [Candidatus Dormibacteraeota bacterium]